MADSRAAMRDRAPMWAWLHLVGFAVWVAGLITAGILGGGRMVVVDTPAEYVLMGLTAAGCIALVTGAVLARLEVGGTVARRTMLTSVAAMAGVFVPAAVRTARRRS
jgi:hypothetical protein